MNLNINKQEQQVFQTCQRLKKKYEKASQKDKDEFEEHTKDKFDDMYHGSTIVSKTFKDVKKKDDIMQKVREQTALLKKRNMKKNMRIKYTRI
jgi:hypothetical protein